MTQENKSEETPRQEKSWREELKAKQKERNFFLRAGCTVTGWTTHEKIWSWAFKKPVSFRFRQRRMDIVSATALVVDTWGKPWMKRRILGFSLGPLHFKGLQVGSIGVFAVGLGIPLCCLFIAINRMATRLKRKMDVLPVVQTVPTPPTQATPSQ